MGPVIVMMVMLAMSEKRIAVMAGEIHSFGRNHCCKKKNPGNCYLLS